MRSWVLGSLFPAANPSGATRNSLAGATARARCARTIVQPRSGLGVWVQTRMQGRKHCSKPPGTVGCMRYCRGEAAVGLPPVRARTDANRRLRRTAGPLREIQALPGCTHPGASAGVRHWTCGRGWRIRSDMAAPLAMAQTHANISTDLRPPQKCHVTRAPLPKGTGRKLNDVGFAPHVRYAQAPPQARWLKRR